MLEFPNRFWLGFVLEYDSRRDLPIQQVSSFGNLFLVIFVRENRLYVQGFQLSVHFAYDDDEDELFLSLAMAEDYSYMHWGHFRGRVLLSTLLLFRYLKKH